MDFASVSEEAIKLKKTVLFLEQEAAKKDKQISQLTSRMREYEMGEYGLTEAVSEIKECRKIIRVRDRDVENLTDEINLLKLQVANLTQTTNDEIVMLKTNSVKDDSFTIQDDSFTKKSKNISQVNQTCQCQFPVFQTQHLDNIYTTQFQNMKLRIELNSICQRAFDLVVQLRSFCKQDQENQDKISQLEEELSNISENVISKKIEMSSWDNFIAQCDTKLIDDLNPHKDLSLHSDPKELQRTISNLLQQISVLKNNQAILIRRYLILSDRESHLRKENLTLRKTLPRNLRNKVKQITTTNCISSDESNFLKKLKETSQYGCKDFSCQENVLKLINVTMKLLAELPLMKNLLQISHYQTQAVEAMWFAQEIEIKVLREQFTIFQAQSDEKMLLGKLVMKLLELQFNQAASVYELKKSKLNEQCLQSWYSTLKSQCEENDRRCASLYLEAVDKAQHLHNLLKDLCQQCNTALESYLTLYEKKSSIN